MKKKKGESTRRWLLRTLRKDFLAGLLVVVPLGVVILILVWFFSTIDNILQPVIKWIFGPGDYTGWGFGIFLVLIYIVGVLTSNIAGRRLVRFGESLLAKVPVLKQLYGASKQVVAGLSGTGLSKAAFREVVLVEFPREGMKTIAFITNEIKDKSGQKLLTVYIPTAPIPSSGYFEIVTEDKIIRTDISIDEAMQMVISSGMVSPTEIDIKGSPKGKNLGDSPPTSPSPRARKHRS